MLGWFLENEGLPATLGKFALLAQRRAARVSYKEHTLYLKSSLRIPRVFHGGLWPAIGGHSVLSNISQKSKTLSLFREAGFESFLEYNYFRRLPTHSPDVRAWVAPAVLVMMASCDFI
jgi:hypothetical protein